MVLKDLRAGTVKRNHDTWVVGYNWTFFWMCAEVTILLFSNKELVLSSFDRREGDDITSESREYNVRALTLSGLTFARIALLIDAFSHNIP
jgi:hypothetical protein